MSLQTLVYIYAIFTCFTMVSFVAYITGLGMKVIYTSINNASFRDIVFGTFIYLTLILLMVCIFSKPKRQYIR